MAAEQKVVESTAADQPQRRGQEFQDQEGHLERIRSAEVSETTQKEDRLATDHVEASEKAEKESHSVTGHAEHSEKDLSAEASEKADSSEKESHSEKAEKESHSATDRAEHSGKARNAEVSETVLRERVSETVLKEEASETESRQDQDSILAARASTGRISTISVMRTRAESAR